jgi:hypothetical protein
MSLLTKGHLSLGRDNKYRVGAIILSLAQFSVKAYLHNL